MNDLFKIGRIVGTAFILSIAITVIAAPSANAPQQNRSSYLSTSFQNESKTDSLRIDNTNEPALPAIQVAEGGLLANTTSQLASLRARIVGDIGSSALCDMFGTCHTTSEMSALPVGMLLMFSQQGAVCPTGWTPELQLSGKYPKGAATTSEIGSTGGGFTHRHGGVVPETFGINRCYGTQSGCLAFSEYVDGTQNSDAQDPPYVNTLFCKKL
ncbi:MAG: hypothetical protein HYS59_00875 [Candidatus Vogelbacteria bacterium]|nr:hypothetical protein [Candidatus Vogelbacteria bacterium]